MNTGVRFVSIFTLAIFSGEDEGFVGTRDDENFIRENNLGEFTGKVSLRGRVHIRSIVLI